MLGLLAVSLLAVADSYYLPARALALASGIAVSR